MTHPGPEDLEERVARLELQTRLLEERLVKRRRPGRDWDGYSAVIASLVGLLALLVAGYTAFLQRKQLRAEVWPRLSVDNSNIKLRLYASNRGTGPAQVTAMRVLVDGKPMKNWWQVARAFTRDEEAGIIFSFLNGRVLPPNTELEIAMPRDNDPSRLMFRALLAGDEHKLGITVCYCSVLDECWVERYGAEPPAAEKDLPDDQCPIISEKDRFNN
jgi:hypothetical protein